jgi:hypothetical protein
MVSHKKRVGIFGLLLIIPIIIGCAIGVDDENKTEDVFDAPTTNTMTESDQLYAENSRQYLSDAANDPYAAAVQSYRAFLLNQRTVWNESGNVRAGRVYRHIHYNSGARFTIFDVNDDGIPELHIDAVNYEVFTYKDGEVILFDGYGANERSKVVLLNNRSIFMTTTLQGGYIIYKYNRINDENDVLQNVTLEETEGLGFYAIDGEAVSKEEYIAARDALINFVEDIGSDMVSWTNYREWYLTHIDEYVPIEDTELREP